MSDEVIVVMNESSWFLDMEEVNWFWAGNDGVNEGIYIEKYMELDYGERRDQDIQKGLQIDLINCYFASELYYIYLLILVD